MIGSPMTSWAVCLERDKQVSPVHFACMRERIFQHCSDNPMIHLMTVKDLNMLHHMGDEVCITDIGGVSLSLLLMELM